MDRGDVRLRRIESAGELASATVLAREFGDWATERIKVELGIVIPPEEDHPTGMLDEVLTSGGRVYVAEVDDEAVGVGGLAAYRENQFVTVNDRQVLKNMRSSAFLQRAYSAQSTMTACAGKRFDYVGYHPYVYRKYYDGKTPRGGCEMWVGISRDEAYRMKPSTVQYINNRWPLIERDMTRVDCRRKLTAFGWNDVPRSACCGCPFLSDRDWQLRKQQPEWAETVAISHKLAATGQYMHRSLKPIDEVDLRTHAERGQPE